MKLINIIGNMKMIDKRQRQGNNLVLTLNNGLTVTTKLKDFNINGLNAIIEKVA